MLADQIGRYVKPQKRVEKIMSLLKKGGMEGSEAYEVAVKLREDILAMKKKMRRKVIRLQRLLHTTDVHVARECKLCAAKPVCTAKYQGEQCWKNTVTVYFAKKDTREG
jgi:hypothetical protein